MPGMHAAPARPPELARLRHTRFCRPSPPATPLPAALQLSTNASKERAGPCFNCGFNPEEAESSHLSLAAHKVSEGSHIFQPAHQLYAGEDDAEDAARADTDHSVCNPCYEYYRRTGVPRPDSVIENVSGFCAPGTTSHPDQAHTHAPKPPCPPSPPLPSQTTPPPRPMNRTRTTGAAATSPPLTRRR